MTKNEKSNAAPYDTTQQRKLSIASWAEEDRPRERLEMNGPESLSKAELLAIIIGSGSQDESAVSLMQKVLTDCNNNLNTLGKMSIRELQQYKGIGPAKAISIMAACELGKRRQMEKAEEREVMKTSADIYYCMHPIMQDLDTEQFWALYMNQSFKLIKKERISTGGITETAVDIRLIIKSALLCNATVIAVSHNHPSGNTTPSRPDDKLTEHIRKACDTMRLYLLDHVIVTDGSYYSYRDHGRL